MPSLPPAIPEADVQRLAKAYLQAVYRWRSNGDWQDIHVGMPVPALEFMHPGVACFGLLSAWNPYSQPREDARNRIADQALEAELDARGLVRIPSFSSATNRSWREPGWVIFDIQAGELDALARRFGQLGTLWWPRGQPVRLRMQAAKPARFRHAAPIDWLE